MEKAAEYFEKAIFPFFQKIKDKHRYLQEQMTLVAQDTVKGQDNQVLKDIFVNKAVKIFISEKYNT